MKKISTLRLSTAAALTAGLVLASVGTAYAAKARNRGKNKNRNSARNIELLRPATGSDADATGVLRVRSNRTGSTGVLKLRQLDPRTWYEVRDAKTDEVLGRVRTNRRGKAKLKIRRKVDAGKLKWELPDGIEIFAEDSDLALLAGEVFENVDGAIGESAPAFGFESYAGTDGITALANLVSFPGGDFESFHVSVLPAATDDARPEFSFEFSASTYSGDELPLDVETVTELGGRDFEVLDGDGNVLVSGTLPTVEALEFEMPSLGDLPMFGDMPMRDELPNFGDLFRGTSPANRGNGNDDNAKAGEHRSGFDFDFDFGDDLDFEFGEDFDFDFKDLFTRMPFEMLPFPLPETEESDLVLRIADADGTLTDVGNFAKITLPDFEWDCPVGDDREHDEDHPRGDFRYDHDESHDADDEHADDDDDERDGDDARESDGDVRDTIRELLNRFSR